MLCKPVLKLMVEKSHVVVAERNVKGIELNNM